MDTHRRRSHRTVTEHRVEQLEDFIGRILRSYRCTVHVHDDCESCGTDLAIFLREAEEKGIDIREKAPF